MKVVIRDKFNKELNIDIVSFRVSLWGNPELELVFENVPDFYLNAALNNIGFRTIFSTVRYSINPDKIAHFSHQS